MPERGLNPETKTGRVHILALQILAEHPEGVQWADLNRMIAERDPALHPKTINGCVWRLTETFPDTVSKPAKGLFKRIK